jgi:hypothetical protein
VAVTWGCSVPLLLREDTQPTEPTKKYRIVGVCYIEGIMNGEVMQEVDMSTLAESDIDIC